jgi:putative transposase
LLKGSKIGDSAPEIKLEDLGAKKIKGRKRHLLVDTEGLVLEVKVHGANVADRDGIKLLLECTENRFACLGHIWLDGAYKGRCREWIDKTLGWTVEIVQRPLKIALREVLKVWAREWAKEGVEIESEKLLPPPKRFEVLPRRWVVERTFGWARIAG